MEIFVLKNLFKFLKCIQASFPGLLVLAGDVEEAVCQHSIYYAIWRKYGVLPERFNWHLKYEIFFFHFLPINFQTSRCEFLSVTPGVCRVHLFALPGDKESILSTCRERDHGFAEFDDQGKSHSD